jgi:hypothetical protein
MDLYKIGLVFGLNHVFWMWLFVDMLKLPYTMLVAANVVLTGVIALISKAMLPYWKKRLEVAWARDRAEGDLFLDLMLFIGIMFVCAVWGSYIVFRRYGAIGALGTLGSTFATQWLI